MASSAKALRAKSSSSGFITTIMRASVKLAAAFVRDLEIMCRPLRGNHTLFMSWPKRVPEPAARTIEATLGWELIFYFWLGA
jgi:hypothetical protein